MTLLLALTQLLESICRSLRGTGQKLRVDTKFEARHLGRITKGTT